MNTSMKEKSSSNTSKKMILAIESHPQDSRVKIQGEVNQPITSNMENDPSNGGLVLILENHPNDSRVKIKTDGIFQTLSSRMGTGGGNVPLVMAIESHPKDSRYQIITPETNQTIPSIMCHDAAHRGLVMKGSIDMNDVNTVVRRLTPLECERLQGFPDGWTDIGEWVDSKGKKHKDADSPRYKELGNSIALPYWTWLMKKIAAQYVRPVRLGSLFDGVSGFGVSVKRAGGELIWASEIEEHPIAVVRKHFGDEETGEVGDYERFIHK